MRLRPVIHQQIWQLRWHFLACFALIMAIPIEEAIVNLIDGDGFCPGGMSIYVYVILAPLLAGLIACANVQADMDDRRYVFWRSKPVGVKTFISLKYIVGISIGLAIIIIPSLFGFLSCNHYRVEAFRSAYLYAGTASVIISLLTYSFCFLINTLVRKTARAWLIGIATASFILFIPFILPINFRSIFRDMDKVFIIYICMILAASVVAFAGSLVSSSRNWQVKTNFKSLLWTGAAVLFMIMMLFTRQIANIKVLDEIESDVYSRLENIDG